MSNAHSCLLYLIPFFIAFFLTMLLVDRKRTMTSRKRHWLHKLLRLFAAIFIAIGLLGLPMHIVSNWYLSFFLAGSLIMNFVVISEMLDNVLSNKDKE